MTDIRVRQAKKSDAVAFLDLWDALDTETEFMLFEPNERCATLDDQKAKLASAELSESVHIVVLEDARNHTLAGFCAGSRSGISRNKHSVHIVLGIRQAYTGQGWGRALLFALERWAKSVNATRLELSVMVNNRRALALYKKLEFDIEGTKRNAILLESGFIDEYIMAKLI